MRDSVLSICRDLLRIDNRPHKEIAKLCDLDASTIKRLRGREHLSFVRSTTVSKVAAALNRKLIAQHIR